MSDLNSRKGSPHPHTHPPLFLSLSRSGELRTQKLKSHLVRTQSLNVLPLKPRVGQYIAIHATLTTRDFFFAYFYPSGPFICIFFQNLSRFLLCWLWLTHGSCVGPQKKKVTLLDAGSRVECPRNTNRLKKRRRKKTYGMMTCEMNNLEMDWSLRSALM